MSNAEVKVIDTPEEQKIIATVSGQNQDTGPPKMDMMDMMHNQMMMMHDDSSEGSSFSGSDSSFSGSGDSSGSGSDSSFSGSNSSFSGSQSSGFSASVSLSSGSGSGSLSSGSLSSGSDDNMMMHKNNMMKNRMMDNNAQNTNGVPNNPKMNDDGFAVPDTFKKHRKKKVDNFHNSDSSNSSFSASLSGSGSSGSASGSGSFSASGDSSSEDDRLRDVGGAPKMKNHFGKKKKFNLTPIPGIEQEFKNYVAEINMQVPDGGMVENNNLTATAIQKMMMMMKKKQSKKMSGKKMPQMMPQMMPQKMMTMDMSEMMPDKMKMDMKEMSGKMKDKMSGKMSDKMMSGKMKDKMKGKMGGKMGGPGKGMDMGMDMKKMSKSKKKMSSSMNPKKMMESKNWNLVIFANNEGCQCFPDSKTPDKGAQNVDRIQRFKTEEACNSAQANSGCQTRCQRINQTLKKLRNFIGIQEKTGKESQSLFDAKELMLVLQTRYVTVCSNKQITLGPLVPNELVAGQPYRGTIRISGGTPPYIALAVGGLPEGLSYRINGNQIIISGTPTQLGNVKTLVIDDRISVSIQDRSGNHGQKGYTIETSIASSSESSKSSSKQSSSRGSSSRGSSSHVSSSKTSSSANTSSSPSVSLSGQAGQFSSQFGDGGSLISGGTAHKQFKLLTKDNQSNDMLTKSLSWWWPSPQEIIDKMFKLANLKKGETVYDLGCGDGRIPIHAAEKWGAFGVGVDFDENLVKQAKKRVTKHGVDKKVEIRHGDALKVDDIHKADVVCLYILDRGMKLIKPVLESKLKKGTRIVSHNYKFKDWKPTDEISTTDKEGHKHWIYLYVV